MGNPIQYINTKAFSLRAGMHNARAITSGVNRHGDFLESHAKPEKHTSSNKLTPVLSKAGSQGSCKAEDCSQEDCTPTTEHMIQRIGKPSSTVKERLNEKPVHI
jgi:hypothetical protein